MRRCIFLPPSGRWRTSPRSGGASSTPPPGSGTTGSASTREKIFLVNMETTSFNCCLTPLTLVLMWISWIWKHSLRNFFSPPRGARLKMVCNY
ncbi:protein early responsive to dehydration 15 [Phtheirospermum japonicum]|uniref:Protein early responsive to dehydration 15 n=1 Tax=Phtheirospermum japonicum TaxID=374723 RepID=A0A830C7P3_9LAMI|nr:protein early responsive to dehydration 15 [Phtheirospermum japonicum]